MTEGEAAYYIMPEWVKPDVSFKEYKGGHFNDPLWHIRAIIDKEYVVMCRWSLTKKRWVYVIENVLWFTLKRPGMIQDIRRSTPKIRAMKDGYYEDLANG